MKEEITYEDEDGNTRCVGCHATILSMYEIPYHAFCEEMN